MKSSFAKDVLKMASAPLCTQILSVILMPIITRLYNPDAYGLFYLFGSIVMPIAVFVSLGYSASVVLPKDDDVAANMFAVSLFFTAVVTALTIPFFWFGSHSFLGFLRAQELGVYVWLIPVNVFAHGIYLAFRFWNVREKQFGRIAISRISNASVNKGIIIVSGLLGFATSGSLIVAGIAGSLTMSVILGSGLWQKRGALFCKTIRWDSMLAGMKRYRKFPMFNLWTDLFSRLEIITIMFLFSVYFSKDIIGYYGLSLAVLSMPMTFVGQSIGEVFFQRGASLADDGERASLVKRLFQRMVAIGLLPFLILAVGGDKLFAFVFGANWAQAGVFAQILSFKIFLAFSITPAKSLATILERQEMLLVLYIATTVVSAASLIIGGLVNNVHVALVIFSGLNGLVFLTFGLVVFRFAGVSLQDIGKIFIKGSLACVPVVLIVFGVRVFSGNSLTIILAAVLGAIFYYSQLLRNDELLRSTVMAIFNKKTSGDLMVS